VFYCHPSLRDWAIARVESELAVHLALRGHEVVAYCPVDKEVELPPWQGIRLEGIKCRTIRGPKWVIGVELPLRVAFRLDPSLDALVLNGESGAWLAFLSARRHGTVAVLAIHGLIRGVLGYRRATTLRLRLRDRLLRWTLSFGEWLDARTAHLAIPGSRRLVRELHAELGLPVSRIVAIANGVEPRPPRAPEEWRAARQQLGLAPECFYAAFLGADPRRKGLDVARRAIARARECGVPAVLLTAGFPAQPSELEVAYGWVEDSRKWQILTASDAFVFPTRYEAYSLAVREAASVGLPIVTTPESGVDEGTSGEDYVICDPLDVEGFAQALVRLYRDPEWAGRVGARGHSILAAWTYERQAIEWESALRRAIEAPNAQGGG
jgi:glycosyltransferase involved in cell wall biosynthesis